MKINYIFFIFLLFIGCSKNKTAQEAQAIKASCAQLTNLSKKTDVDTSVFKTALYIAYDLANLNASKEHDSLILVVSGLMGNFLVKAKKIQNARFYYKNALRFGMKKFTINDLCIAKIYRLIGVSYYGEENFKTALVYFDSVKVNTQSKDAWVLKTQNQISIAECYHRLKNLKAADYLYQEIIPSVKTYFSDKQKVEFYNRHASFLRENKQFKQAIEAAQVSVHILETSINNKTALIGDTTLLANAYYYIAFTYDDSTAYKLAETYYLKALTIYKFLNSMDNYRRGLLNMGLMYRYDKQFDKAEKVLTEGIKLLDKEDETDFNILRKGKLFNNRSEVFLDIKQYEKALADQDSAIYYFTHYNKKASLTVLLMSNRKSLLSTYNNKAKIYAIFAENGSDTEGYKKALKYTQNLIDLTDDIRADYFSDDAKLTLANDIKPALERGIYICKKLFETTKDSQYLQQAFDFVEYSRSMVLYENARLDNQLPPNLKAENAELKKREAALIAKNNVEALQEYLRLKRQFREKIKTLNRNQLANISQLQTTLIKDDKTAFLEFFVGDSSIFVFVLIKNDLKLIELNKIPDFEKQINNLRKSITQVTPMHNSDVFETQSKAIYNYLLNPIITQLNPQINQLIIAPDGVLNYLPFDILIKPLKDSSFITHHSSLKKGSSFKNTAFLVKDYTISYVYSANLLLEQRRTKRETATKLFAGFAAKYENKDTTYAIADVSRAVLTRDGAYQLKGAKEEVNQISNLIGGKAFVNESATEGVFKREANHYKILHFAMHSLTDDKDPALSRLLFTLTPKDTTNDNDLTAAELYATSLKADLAVLSACNTGFGTLNKGEGVMSLARAFTYAGVPSTVTSLWKVPDTETREIMVDFYKNLKNGLSKDAALRAAKLTYLNNAPESVAANPYFWAGFVPMGNMEAMDFSEKRPLSPEGIRDVAARHIWGVLAGVLSVLGVGLWLKWRKKRSA